MSLSHRHGYAASCEPRLKLRRLQDLPKFLESTRRMKSGVWEE